MNLNDLVLMLQTSQASAAQRYHGTMTTQDFYSDAITKLNGVQAKLAAIDRRHVTALGFEAKQTELATDALTQLSTTWQKAIDNLHQNASQQSQELGVAWIPANESEMSALRRELREGELRRFHATDLADPLQAQIVLQGYVAAGNVESARAIVNSPVPLLLKSVIDQAQVDLGVALNPTKAREIQAIRGMAQEITSTLDLLKRHLTPAEAETITL